MYLQRCLVVRWLVPSETAAVSARSVYTIQPLPYHVTSCKATHVWFMRVLVVTDHLHLWQNDRGVLRATAVTRGCDRYQSKSQHI